MVPAITDPAQGDHVRFRERSQYWDLGDRTVFVIYRKSNGRRLCPQIKCRVFIIMMEEQGRWKSCLATLFSGPPSWIPTANQVWFLYLLLFSRQGTSMPLHVLPWRISLSLLFLFFAVKIESLWFFAVAMRCIVTSCRLLFDFLAIFVHFIPIVVISCVQLCFSFFKKIFYHDCKLFGERIDKE